MTQSGRSGVHEGFHQACNRRVGRPPLLASQSLCRTYTCRSASTFDVSESQRVASVECRPESWVTGVNLENIFLRSLLRNCDPTEERFLNLVWIQCAMASSFFRWDHLNFVARFCDQASGHQ